MFQLVKEKDLYWIYHSTIMRFVKHSSVTLSAGQGSLHVIQFLLIIVINKRFEFEKQKQK